MIDELRRARWWLWPLIVVAAVVAWGFPLLWVVVIVGLVLAVKNEWVIHRLGQTRLVGERRVDLEWEAMKEPDDG